MSHRNNTDFTEIIGGQAGKNPQVDVVVAERCDLLREAKLQKPVRDVHKVS